MIKLDNVNFSYHNQAIINNVTYSLTEHKITTLIGPNGSGKSTLFKLLTRTLRPQKGRILLNNHDIWSYTPKKFAQQVAIVHQQNQIYDRIQVLDLVKMGQLPYSNSLQKNVDLTDILNYLELTELKYKDISELSGGQRQRVWLAVALAQQPQYLFLDEPTTYLDLHFQYSFLKLLQKLNRDQNLTICMILHDLNEALAFSDQSILFNQGQIVAQGATIDILVPDLLEPIFNINCELIKTDNGNFLKQY